VRVSASVELLAHATMTAPPEELAADEVAGAAELAAELTTAPELVAA